MGFYLPIYHCATLLLVAFSFEFQLENHLFQSMKCKMRVFECNHSILQFLKQKQKVFRHTYFMKSNDTSFCNSIPKNAINQISFSSIIIMSNSIFHIAFFVCLMFFVLGEKIASMFLMSIMIIIFR